MREFQFGFSEKLMNKKVLIIDDNHSFIDTLKYILKDIPLDFESAFRFQEAAQKISNTSRFRDGESVDKILEFEKLQLEYEQEKENLSILPKKKNPQLEEENQRKLESLKAPLFPKLSKSVFNDNGYALIIVEYDTEVSVKGLQFIQNLVENTGIWKYSDFILLTSRYNELKQTADSLGLPMLEKPVKAPQMLALISEKIKQMDALREKITFLIDRFGKKEDPKPSSSKTPRKRKTTKSSTTKKATGTRISKNADTPKKSSSSKRTTRSSTAKNSTEKNNAKNK